jgi:hypothetical protein
MSKTEYFVFSSSVLKKKSGYYGSCGVVVVQKLNFMAHYSIILKGINMKLRILAYLDKLQFLDKGHYYVSNNF